MFDALRLPLAVAKSSGAFFNAWTAAGLKRDELRNASVLAGLLDPQLCPITGPKFLENILTMTGGGLAELTASFAVGYRVRTEQCPLGGGENRVDVSIEGKDFLIFIEVKIDAVEGIRQLERYDDVLRHKAALLEKIPVLIFLSPRSSVKLPRGAFHLTWRDIAAAARNASRTLHGSQRTMTEGLLAQFATHALNFKGDKNWRIPNSNVF